MKQFFGIFLLVSCVLAKPATIEEYLSIEGDAISVGSLHREVRAPAPVGFATEVADLLSAGTSPKKSYDTKKSQKNASGKSNEGGYYKTYGSDAEGEKGFYKQTYSKGDQGYKTLDTFHKRDGDNYGFEKQTAFGKGHGGHAGGHHGKSGAYTNKDSDDDHEGAGTIVHTHYVNKKGAKNDEEAENDEDGHASATDGDESEHYVSSGEGEHHDSGEEGGDGGHYASGGKGSYSSGGGSSEAYSSGGGDEGSYGTSGSYSSDGEGGHSSDGDHYY